MVKSHSDPSLTDMRVVLAERYVVDPAGGLSRPAYVSQLRVAATG